MSKEKLEASHLSAGIKTLVTSSITAMFAMQAWILYTVSHTQNLTGNISRDVDWLIKEHDSTMQRIQVLEEKHMTNLNLPLKLPSELPPQPDDSLLRAAPLFKEEHYGRKSVPTDS